MKVTDNYRANQPTRKINAAILQGIFFFLFNSQTAFAQAPGPFGPTFVCDNTLYQGINNPTEFFTLNTTNNTLDPFFNLNVITNALGFNVMDGYIYGVDNTNGPNSGTVYRIAQDGTVTDLGDPPNAPRSFSGDVDRNGILFIQRREGGTSRLFKINVTGLTTATDNGPAIPLSDSNFQADDIAFNPLNQLLYGISSDGGVAQIDPVSGTITPFTTTYTDGSALQAQGGAAYFDAFGNFFAYQNNPGILFKYELDLVNNTAVGAEFARGPRVNLNDGAACPFTIKLQKTVTPAQINAGGIVTYTYRISNQNNDSFSGINFSDLLPSGLTYVGGTLNIDSLLGGGSSNNFDGTDTLLINNLNIPANSITTISIDVLVDRTTPPSTVQNQARLDNIPIGFGGPVIDSDFPISAPDVDPTPLVILAPLPPELLLVKRITAINGSTINDNGQNLNVFNDDPTSADDNNPLWPDDDNVFLRGAFDGVIIQPGDAIEYTVYFLSSGGQTAINPRFCDLLPSQTTFVTDTFGSDRGIALFHTTISPLPNPPVPSPLTNNLGDDRGSFISIFSSVPNFCSQDTANNLENSGAVTVNLNDLPNAITSSNPSSSYGFIRFQVRVK